MLYFANPIYDTVFKYWLEDERVVKILLSALLKKTVVEVEMRKHEYANVYRDKISMFRIDFAAKVREEDGHTHLVLIELQKTWLETETLRFRQYLGAQYANPDNMLKDNHLSSRGIPMVAVYLLGHRVGNIEEPILYVKHRSYDYEGNEVTQGLPDPFVESLTHESIIVQIPRLYSRVNNRLEKVLSLFDQTLKSDDDNRVMYIDESIYRDDPEMMCLINRLVAAAADAQVRQNMNVEEEFFQAIEERDTLIMQREEALKQQKEQLAEQGQQLAEQGQQLAEQGQQLAEQGQQLAEQKDQLAEQGQQLAEQGQQLAEQGQQLAEQGQQLAEQGQQLAEQGQQLAEKEEQLAEKEQRLSEQHSIIASSARQMKLAGIPIEQIAAITHLSPAEIEVL